VGLERRGQSEGGGRAPGARLLRARAAGTRRSRCRGESEGGGEMRTGHGMRRPEHLRLGGTVVEINFRNAATSPLWP
jgi:hypothetical protein